MSSTPPRSLIGSGTPPSRTPPPPPPPSTTGTMTLPSQTDALIIGADVTGLAAALDILYYIPKAKVTIVSPSGGGSNGGQGEGTSSEEVMGLYPRDIGNLSLSGGGENEDPNQHHRRPSIRERRLSLSRSRSRSRSGNSNGSGGASSSSLKRTSTGSSLTLELSTLAILRKKLLHLGVQVLHGYKLLSGDQGIQEEGERIKVTFENGESVLARHVIRSDLDQDGEESSSETEPTWHTAPVSGFLSASLQNNINAADCSPPPTPTLSKLTPSSTTKLHSLRCNVMHSPCLVLSSPSPTPGHVSLPPVVGSADNGGGGGSGTVTPTKKRSIGMVLRALM